MIKAVVFGQSHVNAIAAALRDRSEPTCTRVYRFGSGGEAGELTTDEAVAMVAKLPSDTLVFVSTLGTYHNILGLLRSGDPFDFLVNAADRADAKHGTPIPHRAIASAFEPAFRSSSGVRRLNEASASPVYLLGAPPPKQSNEFILEKFMSQKRPTYRGRSVADIGIENPETRLKLWRLESKLLESWAESQGMWFVPAPKEAFDEDGFLARDYYSDDVTHANAAYGALVIRQIEAILLQAEKKKIDA